VGKFVNMNNRGQITIPVNLRDDLDISETEPLFVTRIGKAIVICKYEAQENVLAVKQKFEEEQKNEN
jgi:AbrB family looped-hinge helix DNA binding protein